LTISKLSSIEANVHLLLLAADGSVLDTFALSQPFTLNDQGPQPRIDLPGPGFRSSAGHRIILEGVALDAEDGTIPGSVLNWSITGPFAGAVTFVGENSILAGLGPGDYSASLTIFPDGRFTPRWTCWLAPPWILYIGVCAVIPTTPFNPLDGPTWRATPTASLLFGESWFATSILAQGIRLRRFPLP
jgi:hypothetical protein